MYCKMSEEVIDYVVTTQTNECKISIKMKEVATLDSVISVIENVKEILEDVYPSEESEPEPEPEPPTPPEPTNELVIRYPIPPEHADLYAITNGGQTLQIYPAAAGKEIRFGSQLSVTEFKLWSGATNVILDFEGYVVPDNVKTSFTIGSTNTIMNLNSHYNGSQDTTLIAEVKDVINCNISRNFSNASSLINNLWGLVQNTRLTAEGHPESKCIHQRRYGGVIGEGNTFNCSERS